MKCHVFKTFYATVLRSVSCIRTCAMSTRETLVAYTVVIVNFVDTVTVIAQVIYAVINVNYNKGIRYIYHT